MMKLRVANIYMMKLKNVGDSRNLASSQYKEAHLIIFAHHMKI